MLYLLSIFLPLAGTAARARGPRTERGARTSVRRSVRIRGERTPERGTTTVLPKPGDDGVTGTAARDGNDGALAALPMPLGSDIVGLLAGPGGTPEIDELPAPAEPAGGTCARNDSGASTTSKATNGHARIIDVFSKGEQPIYGAASSTKRD
jgi:hypothetical protein